VTGDRTKHKRDSTLSCGRGPLRQQAVKGRQRLACPLQAHLAWHASVLQGGWGHRRTEQVVDQQMAPALLPYHRGRLAPQHIHRHGLFARTAIQCRMPPCPVKLCQVLLGVCLGIQQSRRHEDHTGADAPLWHAHLQQGLGFDAAHAGEIMLPSACIWGLTSLATGRLSDRVESRWLILIGSLSQAISLVLFAGLTPWSSTWAVMVLLTLRSLTRGFIQSPIMTVTMATLPDHQLRLGVGLRGLLNSLGGTFGVAFTGIFLQERLAVRTYLLGENQHLDAFEHGHMVEMVRQRLLEAGEERSLLPVQTEATFSRWLVQEATTLAYHDMFLLSAVLVLLTAVPVLWLRQRRTTA